MRQGGGDGPVTSPLKLLGFVDNYLKPPMGVMGVDISLLAELFYVSIVLAIWKMIHGVFRLPEGAYGAYKGDIIETIQRLGFQTTKKACKIFVEATEDHPPDGNIQTITQLLHWKKIDKYVAMIPLEKKLRYYACLICERVIQIKDTGDIDQVLSLPSGKCTGPPKQPKKAHEERAYIEVTATVVDCQNRGMTESQIRAVIDKRIKTLREERGPNADSGD